MILVTGATGFLGSMLVQKLQEDSFDVMPLHFGTQALIADDYWQADLTRIDHLEKLAQADKTPETIIHLAGYIDIALQPKHDSLALIPGHQDIASLYAINVSATANLVDYCLKVGVKHLIFASTQAVYGMPQGVLTETSPCRPLEHYAASKLCAEKLLEVASHQGLKVTIARFPGLYAHHRQSGVVYNFCKSALQKKEIIIQSSIPLPIDVIHMNDVIDAFIKMVQIKDYQFLLLNIATGQPCSLNVLADNVAQLVPGCTVTHTTIAQPVVTMDSSQAQKILGWKPLPQEQRLSQMLDALQSDLIQSSTTILHERFL